MRKSTAQAIMTLAAIGTMAIPTRRAERREDRLPAPEYTHPCQCGSTKWRWSPSVTTYICDRCGRRASG